MSRTGRKAFFLAIFVFAEITFLSLGVWQVQRRAWKLDLIEKVEERRNAAPVLAPGPDVWPNVTAQNDAYRHVTAHGTFLHDRETLVQALTSEGAGFWVLTPLQTDRGYTILINRGFVPPDKRDPATRSAGQTRGDVTVTGLLRVTEPKGTLLRANDPASGRWYSRDVAAIAAARNLADNAPYFIDADSTPNEGGYPIGGLTVVDFPNNHLLYALTWFGLALITALTAAAALREKKSPTG